MMEILDLDTDEGRARYCRSIASTGGDDFRDYRTAEVYFNIRLNEAHGANPAHLRRSEEDKRESRNRAARERNAALREICGTSAAAARRDMGI